MAEQSSMWTGRDEHEGVLAQPRKDLKPPPHWRLEAVAYTPMPRSLTIGADRRRAVFIQDADSSDVWLLDLESGASARAAHDGPRPGAVLGGRAAADVTRRLDGRVRRPGSRLARPRRRGTGAQADRGLEPRLDRHERLVISVERDDTTRLAVVSARDPWPRRLAAAHEELDEYGDEGEATVSPDGTEVAYTFTPRADLNRSEIRVASLESGGRARADRHAAHARPGRRLVARRGRASRTPRSAAASTRSTSSPATAPEDRQLTSARADHGELDWHPDGDRAARAARPQQPLRPRGVIDAEKRRRGRRRARAGPGPRRSGPPPATSSPATRTTPRRASCAGYGRASRGRRARAGAPVGEERAARRARGRELPVLRRPRDPRLPDAPARGEPGAARARRRLSPRRPHLATTATSGTATPSTSSTAASPGSRSTSAAQPATGATSSACNHGVWGVDDTKDCLAAADFLRTLDWIDGERLGIFGASYGSYMALLSVTDDPDYRYRCAVAKYGDCDITTSWAQGDREGVQDLERMMGPPSAAREAYLAGSAYHRLENVRVPLLIAHGERDERVSPKQSEQLVGAAPKARQDLRIRDLPDRGARAAQGGPAARLLQAS